MNTKSKPASKADSPDKLILAEVWGDVVDLRQLAIAIVIGGTISLSAFLIAAHFMQHSNDAEDLGRSYAMLVGLVACILSGAICAKLFKPKRIVTEGHENDGLRAELISELAQETGTIGKMSYLPTEAVNELKEIDLYDLFLEQEAKEKANKGKV
ncbi:hypothetical protein N5853_11170 [Bartonella sp. HY329]|uniref:hypothetical protein n=1 Tax=unclassified Bartonella TaxID=2645622 RepID=UPI0021C6FA9C|nr:MULTISPECIES: hypothetical protein [unclassified Bartonella]UXM94652.1 hypothetical protein N5853_11170 [Bartonella sp. HY329]UXN08975.1 hypothetical protein N5852_11180 [Bartonella sp. HY328]